MAFEMSLIPSTNPVTLLIVDDDDVSVMAIKRCIRSLDFSDPVLVAKDGVHALELLRESVEKNGELQPFIVTLDLSMPRMNGLEFLKEIRSDTQLNRLVVFVLTTSDAPSDISTAYDHNVAGYILKENPTDSLQRVMSMLHDYKELALFPA